MTLLAQTQNQYGIHKFKIEATKIFGQLCHTRCGDRARSPKLFTKFVALTSNKMLKIPNRAKSTI